ncbi:hypothetical protein FQN50_000255 [Emmonsiellopsis sp. PD_5]|nr:hypothetical protein FQN50_000255 [Emmonsiellopsis sp. PD_5]
MSGLRGMVKDGWHPKGKDGGKESWRGDFKGINQVAGWVGKGKSGSTADRADHVSRPLSSLKDPSSFPPPPKHINRAGGATSSPHTVTSSRGGGLGSPLTAAQIQSLQEEEQAQREAEEAEAERARKAPPPVPYRANTTGLTTEQFLPPPVRRSNTTSDSLEETRSRPVPKPKPSLPPRLPPRGATQPSSTPSPPPAYEAVPTRLVPPMNQSAVSRLSNAGVSVPSLGISNGNAAERPALSPQNELQSRFARMNTSSPTSASTSPTRPTPTEGTTMQQKQQALQTAHSFSRDPTSVSRSDARSAASTARNFRERHSDQIGSGRKKLSEMNQKYGITKRINEFIEDQKSPAYPDPQHPPHQPTHPDSVHSPQSPAANPYNNNRPDLEALNKRKPPPPPPPPKKPSIQASPVGGAHGPSPPPPLPLGTKPR